MQRHLLSANESFAKDKIEPFAWKLHAIKYPAKHPLLMWAGQGPLAIDGALTEGWAESPGAIMLDPDARVSTKACALKLDFRPIAAYVIENSTQSGDRVSDFSGFCADEIDGRGLRRLRNNSGTSCTIGELLPPDETLGAMFETWMGHHASRCIRAEKFITASLRQAGVVAEC